ncbi:MAG: LLM class flavin-dependent oxidoreductase [Candidatus Dormibacteraeota bacterium]|nr:LLM class flavin-dependent oxidoreductase [Candidatus Dormibacteraeota bacterium]
MSDVPSGQRLVGFSLDPRQALEPADELRLVRLGAELGYQSAWTPAGPDASAFESCLRWYKATGLRTGIAVVPASGQPAAFYAEHAKRVWEESKGSFVLGVGSGEMQHAVEGMRRYIGELRSLLHPEQPIYVAALGPRMLNLAAEIAGGVALNWCTPSQLAWSRSQVEEGARPAGRQPPPLMEYIRTSVDPDRVLAERTLVAAAQVYSKGRPAYRKHFERMGIPEGSVGAAGRPGEVRQQFERLAKGLDEAIVRVLVTRPGHAESAELTLRECAPRR